jgi:hypothetical protein
VSAYTGIAGRTGIVPPGQRRHCPLGRLPASQLIEGVSIQPLQGPAERGLRGHRAAHPQQRQQSRRVLCGAFGKISKLAKDSSSR